MAREKPVIALGIFCEDIREEAAGTITLVGVLSDNIGVPSVPGVMPQIAVYVRTVFDIDTRPEEYSVRLEVPWHEQPLFTQLTSEAEIANALDAARNEGAPSYGLLTYAKLNPFPIQAAGRALVIIRIDGIDIIAGHLNIKAGAQFAAKNH